MCCSTANMTTFKRRQGSGLGRDTWFWISGWWWLCHLASKVMKVLRYWTKIRGKRGKGCETDDRSCPLSKRSCPGVNIAFPCLLQLQACSLVHLLQRVKMEGGDAPVGWGEYRLPSQEYEIWTDGTHKHMHAHTHTHILLEFNATAVTSQHLCGSSDPNLRLCTAGS